MVQRRTTLRLVGIGATLSLALAACGASEEVKNNDTQTSTQAEGNTQYPIKIENCGETLTIDQAPTRVVSLDQGSTEILLSLGLQDKIVGTASWTDPILPELEQANENVPRLADNAPTYEVVLDTDPDFITASFGRHFKKEGGVAPRERFEETGIPTYLSPTDCDNGESINAGGTRSSALTPEVIYEEITQLAEIFDVQSRGEELVDSLKQRVEKATKDLPDADGQTVAFWFADTKTPYMAGGQSEPQMLANMTGLSNVYAQDKEDWPAVTWEDVADKQPDILVLGDLERDRFPGDRLKDKKKFLAEDPLTKNMKAVKEENYIALHGAELNPSIRFVDGLEKIAEYLREHDKR
ncbi:ABC transporter substrate-binding protein [Corynebacterium pelargi]|uniref:Corrinoid ABC transporter substrate-binding protein n=1 Tax=Corynebacterium pelargi TaxID=1471400 RepID=A0A410WBE8_9CORY|nr:ABC transporter substrate-binding protein [Corynebacterium pelargi]QAU53281.1 corrinoid ABC transporter substrate-binding protein [Corynebacterium pelargi]GGG73576.1 ABC transporter substrate-binding protein [Corynebacterium pelargi]